MKKTRVRAAGKEDVEMGHRIRVRRVELKMSQMELGDRLGVSFQQVQKYEKGTNRISTTRMNQIAKALEVPLTFFFKDSTKQEQEVQSLLALDASFSIRLLRAYHRIEDQRVQRSFVTLIESVAPEAAVA